MIVLGLCFDGAAHGGPPQHDAALAALSYLVATLASFTALQMIERLRRTEGRARRFWHAGAATVLGGGIWSMHFIAMLACRTPFTVAYAPEPTTLSGAIAVAVVWLGLKVFDARVTASRLLTAGGLIGLGVAAMHYVGMSGMRFEGHVVYRPSFFLVSIAIALAAATAALWLASRLQVFWHRALAAAVMGVAVCGMHYVAMAGTRFVVDVTQAVPSTLVSPTVLAVAVVAGVLMVVLSGLLCAYLDQRLELRSEQEAARLRALNETLAARSNDLERANREAQAATAAKSAFLATMSHEIRTPLNGVLGMVQVMQADELNAVQKTRLEVIQQSGLALLAILNDVLDLSKIEAGRMELEETPFDLSEVVSGAHAAFTALAHKKGLSFSLHVEAAARGCYRGDPTRVRQILYNLISNALKFTDAGEVRVTVLRQGGALVLTVTDTGIGMTDDQVRALFQKFVQADASTTRRFGGTGLSLAICDELASLMGGGIRVESRIGDGSTFTVTLPLERLDRTVEAPPLPAAPVEAAQPVVVAPMLRVLAAEDNAINQLVLKTLLAQAGIEAVFVNNGAEAVDAWALEAWDVILMDMQMPVMGGLEATAAIRIRERQEGRRRTPVIALTANAMAHHMQQYEDGGLDGHVAKPIQAERLFAVIEDVLDRREAFGHEGQLDAAA